MLKAPQRMQKRISIEKVFLAIYLFFGILYLIIKPPFQSPDEPAHFYRSIQISNGEFIGQKLNDSLSGGFLKKRYLDMANDLCWDIPFKPEKKYDISRSSRYFIRNTSPQEAIFVDFRNTVLCSPAPYIPQSVGIFIAESFQLPILLS